MVKVRTRVLVTLMALVSVASALVGTSAAESAEPTQFTLFNQTGSQTATSYFNPNFSQPLNYKSPVNYAAGRLYYRIEILQKPSSKSTIAQLCFWRHTAAQKFKYETCASTRAAKYQFKDEGVYYVDAGRPVDFWKKGGVYDWSKQASLMRFMLFDGATRTLLIGKSCGTACYQGNDLAKHIPIRFKAEVIVVAKGATLTPPSGWRSSCPSDWSGLCRGSGGNPPTTSPPATTPPATDPPTTTPPATSPPSGGSGSTKPVVTLTATNTAFTATWGTVNGANKYQLRYKASGTKKWIWKPVTTSKSLRVSGLKRSQRYIVEVRAYANKKWNGWSRASVTTR